MMEQLLDDCGEQLPALAEQLRARGDIGRSEIINRLFDFLLEQSLAGRSPKEFEIAQEVFGKDEQFDVAQDATVRVHIHRLRKKLEEAAAGATGDRIVIPRGEYRLSVQRPVGATVPGEAGPTAEGNSAGTPAIRPRWRLTRPSWPILVSVGLGIAVGALVGGWATERAVRPDDARAETSFWQPLAASRRPAFVVTGDYYMFGEAPDAMQVTRLVREFSINSREDLDEFLMTHPDYYGRFVDVDLHYLPVSTATALREVLPLVNGIASSGQMGRPWVISMSRLAPEAFKGSNIVYVGFLSGLGLLRDPLFEASGFTIGASYDELIDRASGKHYVSEWQEAAGSRKARRDFAYLASFPGPSGNRILVISGTRDAAVMQAAEIATDKVQLDQIARRAGKGESFEALYEVRTLGTLNLGSELIVARSLKLDGLWRPGAARKKFPDELQLPSIDSTTAGTNATRRP